MTGCLLQQSTNPLRKFCGPLDIVFSILQAKLGMVHACCISAEPVRARQALEVHRSQYVWYAKGLNNITLSVQNDPCHSNTLLSIIMYMCAFVVHCVTCCSQCLYIICGFLTSFAVFVCHSSGKARLSGDLKPYQIVQVPETVHLDISVCLCQYSDQDVKCGEQTTELLCIVLNAFGTCKLTSCNVNCPCNQ